MASFKSIAVRRANAIASLNATMKRLADGTDVEAVQIPTQGRDVLVLQAQQLETLAGFFAAVADAALPGADGGFDYERMSKTELEALAEARGIVPTESHGVDGSPLKRDYVLALKADDEATNDAEASSEDEGTDDAEALDAKYRRMTKAELEAEALTRSIDLSGMKTKDEYVDAFLAADGVTEDEQAEADTAESE